MPKIHEKVLKKYVNSTHSVAKYNFIGELHPPFVPSLGVNFSNSLGIPSASNWDLVGYMEL